MGLSLQLSNDPQKVELQIRSLEWELEREDLPEKDREIFEKSLIHLKKHLDELRKEEECENTGL